MINIVGLPGFTSGSLNCYTFKPFKVTTKLWNIPLTKSWLKTDKKITWYGKTNLETIHKLNRHWFFTFISGEVLYRIVIILI